MNFIGQRMVRYGMAVLLVLLLGVSSGCASSGPAPPVLKSASVLPSPAEVTLPPEITATLETAVAEAMDISPEAIAIESAEEVEWGNACLDAPKPDEVCAEVITPGYRVRVDTPKGETVVHTNRTGSSYRLVSP